MSDQPNGVEVARDAQGRWSGKVFGPIVIVVLILLAHGALTVAQHVEDQRQHERLVDAVEALIWTNMPEPYKSQVPPPKWLRDKLRESVAK